MALKERNERPCDYVLEVLDRQVAGIDRRVGELVALRAELLDLKATAAQLPEDGTCYCRLIEHAKKGGAPQRPGRRSFAG